MVQGRPGTVGPGPIQGPGGVPPLYGRWPSLPGRACGGYGTVPLENRAPANSGAHKRPGPVRPNGSNVRQETYPWTVRRAIAEKNAHTTEIRPSNPSPNCNFDVFLNLFSMLLFPTSLNALKMFMIFAQLCFDRFLEGLERDHFG